MNDIKGRLLGVDHGTRRVGVAVSDGLQMTARARGFLDGSDPVGVVDAVAAMAMAEEVVAVVVGLPLNMNGSEGPKAQQAQAFASALRAKLSVPVHLWDERLTTRQADRYMIAADLSRKKRRRRIDGLAAQILLQSYLDAH